MDGPPTIEDFAEVGFNPFSFNARRYLPISLGVTSNQDLSHQAANLINCPR